MKLSSQRENLFSSRCFLQPLMARSSSGPLGLKV